MTTKERTIGSSPYVSFQTHGTFLFGSIDEPYLTGGCLHEILWLCIRDAILDTPSVTQIVIGFRKVRQVSSLTISVLLRLQRYAAERFITLRLIEMRLEIRSVFKTMRLDGTAFTISDSRQDVLGQFDQAPTHFNAFPRRRHRVAT